MHIKPIQHISDIAEAEWNRLIPDHNPFLRHSFLAALETSGSVGEGTGWDSLHLALFDETGALHGALPSYIKHHSYGEYVFDHSWAHGFERAGGQYYPKLVGAVPFTPVPGPRLLTGVDNAEATQALIHGTKGLVDTLSLSSAHVNFITADDRAAFEQAGWIIRKNVQFHWHNRDYSDFDDFLSHFASRKRKNIRKERQSLKSEGVRFHRLTGADITPSHWDKFYHFYLATIDKKWGGAYLTRAFFDQIGATMADDILLVMAEYDGDIIAGALNLMSPECLYGRNWGCALELPNLHFETCYYQAIEFAIETGRRRVEAGAQGMHKVQRGYLPQITYSAHYIQHDGFADAVRRFCEMENRAVEEEAQDIATLSPFRQAD